MYDKIHYNKKKRKKKVIDIIFFNKALSLLVYLSLSFKIYEGVKEYPTMGWLL